MFGGGMWIIIGAGVLGLITVCIIIVCWRVFRQVSCPNSKKRSASRHKGKHECIIDVKYHND